MTTDKIKEQTRQRVRRFRERQRALGRAHCGFWLSLDEYKAVDKLILDMRSTPKPEND